MHLARASSGLPPVQPNVTSNRREEQGKPRGKFFFSATAKGEPAGKKKARASSERYPLGSPSKEGKGNETKEGRGPGTTGPPPARISEPAKGAKDGALSLSSFHATHPPLATKGFAAGQFGGVETIEKGRAPPEEIYIYIYRRTP